MDDAKNEYYCGNVSHTMYAIGVCHISKDFFNHSTPSYYRDKELYRVAAIGDRYGNDFFTRSVRN